MLFFQRVLRVGCALNKLFTGGVAGGGVSSFLTAGFFSVFICCAVYSLSLVSSFRGLRHEL